MQLQIDRLILRRWNPDDPGDVAAALDIYGRDEVMRWLDPQPKPWQSLDYAREKPHSPGRRSPLSSQVWGCGQSL